MSTCASIFSKPSTTTHTSYVGYLVLSISLNPNLTLNLVVFISSNPISTKGFYVWSLPDSNFVVFFTLLYIVGSPFLSTLLILEALLSRIILLLQYPFSLYGKSPFPCFCVISFFIYVQSLSFENFTVVKIWASIL
jgi:hypothetical protein